MNRIARSLLLVGLALLLSATTASAQEALDWGGSLSTSNAVQAVPEGSDEDAFTSNQRLTLYLTTPLGRRWEFVSQAAATLSAEPVFALDVEKLYLQRTTDFTDETVEREVEQYGGLLQVASRFGRFSLSEPSGLVLRHPVDGVDVTIEGRRSRVALGMGYAGFINKEFSALSLSLRDSTDGTDDEVYFGPARLLGRGSLALPNVIGAQNLTLAFAFQQDLRDPDTVVAEGASPSTVDEVGGLVDTQYAVAQLDGPVPLVPSLFYNLAYVLNTGRTMGLLPDDSVDDGESYQYQPITAHLVSGRVDFFMPGFFSSSARAGLTYSSGDADYQSFVEGNSAGEATMFTAATPAGKGAVFGLQSGNSTVAEVSFGMKPFSGSSGLLESLLTRVVLYNFFRSAGTGPVSAAAVDAGADGNYLGSEVDLDIRWRPFSDLGVGLTTGFLFANDAVLSEGSESFDYVIRLNASLSF